MRINLLFLIIFFLLSANLNAENNRAPGSVKKRGLSSLRKDTDPETLGVLEAYKEAVLLEQEITQLYRETRATKLSRIQKQSLKKSLTQTLTPLSKRLEPDEEAINLSASNSEDLKIYQEELKKVMQENDAIVANSEAMLKALTPEKKEVSEEYKEFLEEMFEEADPESAQEEDSESSYSDEMTQRVMELLDEHKEQKNKAEESLEDALEEMEDAEKIVKEKIEKLASENKESKSEKADGAETDALEKLKQNINEAKDAVQNAIESIKEEKKDIEEKVEQARTAMKKISEALKESSEANKNLAQTKNKTEQSHTEKAMKSLKTAENNMAKASEAILEVSRLLDAMSSGELSGDKQIAQMQSLGILARADSGLYLDITKQMKGKNLNIKPMPVTGDKRPPRIKENFNKLSGRKVIREGGTPAVWFYIDDWYILGPYDNRGRMNIQRVYPPESIIDLDANYPGKDSKILKWHYNSFSEAMIVPIDIHDEYTIYYGYTEIYFEEAADLWIAVGSDDRSDLWINDMPVWHSSNKLKGWDIGEGYRKVHFKKGYNKILFRLENGWKAMGFSILVNTHVPEE